MCISKWSPSFIILFDNPPFDLYIDTTYVHAGAQLGGAMGAPPPLLHFILWQRTCLLKDAQKILHLDQAILSHPIQIYLRPSLKITQLRPCIRWNNQLLT